MSETANLGLPLLAQAQAQKHVTVNEALTRLDRLVMLGVASRTIADPPPGAEGLRHVVPAGATGDWAGRDGSVAIHVNGGWDFETPAPGWRAYVEDEGREIVFASGVWGALTAPQIPPGAVAATEFEHVFAPGGAQAAQGVLPEGSIVFGVTARVIEGIVGPTGWNLGVAGAETRYGEALSTATGAGLRAALTAPLAFSADTPLILTPRGGDFVSGRVKLAVHAMTLAIPDP